ncbi:AAEL013874-PA, partial [Aedes aegypti]
YIAKEAEAENIVPVCFNPSRKCFKTGREDRFPANDANTVNHLWWKLEEVVPKRLWKYLRFRLDRGIIHFLLSSNLVGL